jgi:hypothetical protein
MGGRSIPQTCSCSIGFGSALQGCFLIKVPAQTANNGRLRWRASCVSETGLFDKLVFHNGCDPFAATHCDKGSSLKVSARPSDPWPRSATHISGSVYAETVMVGTCLLFRKLPPSRHPLQKLHPHRILHHHQLCSVPSPTLTRKFQIHHRRHQLKLLQ